MFKQYLTEVEDKNKYTFLIKIAAEHCDKQLKEFLSKFDIIKFKKVDAEPIQSTPLDFPLLSNVRVHGYQVQFKYPTTPLELEAYIAEHCNVPLATVKVHGDDSSLIANKYTPEEFGDSEDHQKLVGDTRVSDFLKELQKTRADHQPKQYKGVNDQILAKECPTGE